jgi:hypothetical protein
MDGSSAVNQLRRRHESSKQPSSRALVATIDALTEALNSKNMGHDVASYLGACVSALDSVSSADDAPTVAAVCTLLAALLPHVPKQYTRSKFRMMAPIVCKVTTLLYEAEDMAGVRSVAQVLAHILSAPDMESTWAPVQTPFLVLVRIAMENNPKARKAGQDGLAEVLASYRGTSAHQPASDEIEQGAFPRTSQLCGTHNVHLSSRVRSRQRAP